ncbi:MAG: hypothetical protein Q7R58_01835 [bacterium]|nr:hypothetical protein [bacterium]
MPEELENKEISASRQKSMVIGVAVVILAVVVGFGAIQYYKIQQANNGGQKVVTEFSEPTPDELLQHLQQLDEETKDNPRLSSAELQARLKTLDEETKDNPRLSSEELQAQLEALDVATKDAQ